MANREWTIQPSRAAVTALFTCVALGLSACDSDRGSEGYGAADDENVATPATADSTMPREHDMTGDATPGGYGTTDDAYDTGVGNDSMIAGAAGTQRRIGEQQVDSEQAADTREQIDQSAQDALAKLGQNAPEAGDLRDRAYGYAVFDADSDGLLVSNRGEAGVAVVKDGGERTYMYMLAPDTGGTSGAGSRDVVLLFEDQQKYDDFVDGRLEIPAVSQTTAGAGDEAAGNFQDGVAAYELTDDGRVVGASLAAVAFWPSGRLNAESTGDTTAASGTAPETASPGE